MATNIQFNIDYFLAKERLSPTSRRLPKFQGFLQCLIKPINQLSTSIFVTFKTDFERRAKINSQKAILEAYLNFVFEIPELDPKIFINSNEIVEADYRYDAAEEPQTFSYRYDASEFPLTPPDEESYRYTNEETVSGFDFTVNVPIGVLDVSNSVTLFSITSIVDLVNLSHKKYNVVNY